MNGRDVLLVDRGAHDQLGRADVRDGHETVIDRDARADGQRTVQHHAVDRRAQRLLLDVPVGRVQGAPGDLKLALQLQQFGVPLGLERFDRAPDFLGAVHSGVEILLRCGVALD